MRVSCLIMSHMRVVRVRRAVAHVMRNFGHNIWVPPHEKETVSFHENPRNSRIMCILRLKTPN